jgi:hypothetical protein
MPARMLLRHDQLRKLVCNRGAGTGQLSQPTIVVDGYVMSGGKTKFWMLSRHDKASSPRSARPYVTSSDGLEQREMRDVP